MIKNSQRPLLKAAAIVAHEHHEKYDGTGYPNKLKGEDIHIYGRITAVADVFDALGSDRVYKKAWDDERIFKLFREEKGKQFDPELVDLFFENIDDILEARERFKDVFLQQQEEKDIRPDIKVLGAFGTRLKGFGTSSFFINSKNVLDAGNLLNTLDEESAKVENIWLTDSHLDHISDIAYILDNYFSIRTKSLNLIGLPETIQTLKESFFNGTIWPDFSKIKMNNSEEMAVKYTELELGTKYKIGEDEFIEAFATDHTIASCGYIVTKSSSSILITADTYSLENILEILNLRDDISTIVVECSFPSEMGSLAKESKHLTPKLLFDELKKLKRDDLALYINHVKPLFMSKIMADVEAQKGKWEPKILKDGDIIKF